MMKFKVELELHGRIFFKRYLAYGLADLHEIIKKEFPTASILSIFGGPAGC